MFDWIKARKFNKQLLEAAKNGNREEADRLLAKGADKDHKDQDGFAPIHHAVEGGHLAVMELLINAGADLAAKVDPSKRTALHIAVRRRNVGIVKRLLVGAGTDREAKDKEGFRPIHYAVQEGCVAAVKALAEAGVEIDARTRSGFKAWSALELAVFGGHLEIVQCLLEAGANKEAKDENGFTALHLASSTGEGEIVKYLLDVGAAPESRNTDGQTAQDLAMLYGHSHVLAHFLGEYATSTASAISTGETDKSELVPDHQFKFVEAIAYFRNAVLSDPGRDRQCYDQLCSRGKDALPAACLWNVVLSDGEPIRFIDDYVKDYTIDPRAEAKRCARAMLRAVTMGKRQEGISVNIIWFIRVEIKAARHSANPAVNALLGKMLEEIGVENSQSTEARSV